MLRNKPYHSRKTSNSFNAAKDVEDSLTQQPFKSIKKYAKKSFNPKEKPSMQPHNALLRLKISNNLPQFHQDSPKSQKRRPRKNSKKYQNGSCKAWHLELVSSKVEASRSPQKTKQPLRRQVEWSNAAHVGVSSTKQRESVILLSVRVNQSRCRRWTQQLLKRNDYCKSFYHFAYSIDNLMQLARYFTFFALTPDMLILPDFNR